MSKVIDLFSSLHEGKVWKLYSDPFTDFLLLEERNEELREVHFYVYDINDFSYEEVIPYEEESWWVGVHDFQYGVCVFHLYQDGIEPIPHGVLVYDFVDEDVLLEDKELQFVSRKEHLFVFENSEGEKQEIDLLKPKKNSYQKRQHLILEPRYYNEESKHYQTFVTFLTDRFEVTPVGAIEYIESVNYIIISFNRFVENKLDNLIFIVDYNGDIQYSAVLMKGTKGIGMGTFFLHNDLLCFVQNKNEFKVVQLTH